MSNVIAKGISSTLKAVEKEVVRANIGLFAGEIKLVASTIAPEDTLKCNGALVSRTTYPRLFAAIGTTFGVGDGSTTFGLPDLRGEFVRGWDDSRGVDSGRAFGSFQDDELQSHSHSMNGAGSHNHSITLGDFDGGTEYADRSGSGVYGSANTSTVGDHTHSINATGGFETRPRNIALTYVITT